MKTSIVVSLTLVGLLSIGGVYTITHPALTNAALTNTQAEHLAEAAYTQDNTVDLSKLESAAKSGYAAAQMWLGAYWSAEKDHAKADYWYEKGAAQGNAKAEYNLGLAYYLGHGVPQDYAKADYWFSKAAAHGYARAENNLGDIYANGHGVPQDYAKADYWAEKAAAQGYAKAEFDLGISYYYGQGVPQDTMTAITWWKKAATQGGRTGRRAQHDINVAEGG